ncbi:Phosphatidylinositol 3-kinase Ras-binding (PI3K RBD) domain [Trypanosoma melophagium]|uniref:Phosphatidylinositol 3-kinase Ras-binding (PI3K RBD) domain n=1 Tax=Trypanosoma melophagium TaxID=715481 RepID=UPI00351A1613|nr:Phosphatidylinositol 3-kinase Ras-binding (PI3K RBD) domain [Trypanosoma melophagium]
MTSPRKIPESKGLNIEEELEADDYFEVDTSEDFERLFESSRRKKRNVTEISNVINTLIFQEKDEDTESDIEYIIEYITGSESQWRSNSPEVNEFRTFLAASFPVVSFAMMEGKNTVVEHAWHLLGQQWNAYFLLLTLTKVKNRGLVYIFRIQGRKENVYGDEILINFRYIRDCVTQQREINVVVESHKESLFTDPLFVPSYPSAVMRGKNELNLDKENPVDVGHQSEISLWDINDNLIIEAIDSLQNLVFSQGRAKEGGVREGEPLYIAILVEIYFGGKLCCLPQLTKWVSCCDVVG